MNTGNRKHKARGTERDPVSKKKGGGGKEGGRSTSCGSCGLKPYKLKIMHFLTIKYKVEPPEVQDTEERKMVQGRWAQSQL